LKRDSNYISNCMSGGRNFYLKLAIITCARMARERAHCLPFPVSVAPVHHLPIIGIGVGHYVHHASVAQYTIIQHIGTYT